MKKTLLQIAAIILIAITLNSCATVFAGKSACKTKPAAGQPQRQIRIVPLILDCGGFVWLAIDFGTGAIYKPCDKNPKK